MTKSNGYSDLKLIDIKRSMIECGLMLLVKRDALLVHNYALEYAEKHAPDWNDLPPVAPELVRCIKTAIENSCINSTTEFATWLISCNLASKLTLCVGLGVTSMAQFYLAAELPMDGQLQHMRAFLTSLYADVALQKRAQELCATIVPFKAYFPSALQYVCTMVEELAPCMHRMDLGVVSKRGELRTERWKERHVVLFRGELVYASPGSASALGVVQLDRAFVREVT
eukprot:TRINITY_DN874_c0_g1_i3.p1 TRINITY_DN874_c0_g1~~TRINITY_DN874_c0_g1_i3.p1  ORF type:complete len:227 (-),score=18.65 TRINITY_DN874_c0_g1_i3:54-734(-)